MTDYKKTLNLPKTSFPMRASLPKKEPEMIAFWEQTRAYERMIQAREDRDGFVLHDGPPYANGHIHLGTAMNKILKDIIVKSQNFTGRRAEYVPGWDCHGLPIELKVEQELGQAKKDLSILDVRKRCREYALKYLDIQRNEFKRLGVLGTWEDPYLTMDPAYEAATAGELGTFMRRGSVMRNKKPIHWCPSCETALAEAEVEYADKTSPSIYVRFPLTDSELQKRLPEVGDEPVFVLIWTTTPWTIPNNMAVALHPDVAYVLVRAEGGIYILAEKLLAECTEKFGWKNPHILKKVIGHELEGLQAEHPIYGRPSPLVLAEYVTLETGTGCVHTAPGHGQEDYETGLRYGLEVHAPVDDQGRFLPSVEFFAGYSVFEANPKVVDKLSELGALLAQEKITHAYPHCWRCKKPVIFRATTQWFISMQHNDLRDKAVQAIDEDVRWIPSWGRLRIRNMIAHRPDWCISRQRSWGVPIIALLCKDCGHAYFDPDWVQDIVDRFAAHPQGADYWFEAQVSEIVPQGLSCPHCQGNTWEKETDILDVWFDSGTSYAAVLEKRKECTFPADMYLEGSDQHRGWFHSSLLASVGTRDIPPYRSVLTHGFVVDGEGKKMSKSIGNVIAPQDIMDRYGAEILRMWVASENYQEDLRISETILKQLVDNYRRIRNTCRFILGNLHDFHPEHTAVPVQDLLPLDRYVLDLARERHVRITHAYTNYELHKVFHSLHTMCVTDLSSFYLDVLKDRLYVNAPDSLERRSAQTALHTLLSLLLWDMAPILSFTAEEAYQYLPGVDLEAYPTIFTYPFTLHNEPFMDDGERRTWDRLLTVRAEVTRAIEPKRKSGHVGHSLDVSLHLYAEGELLEDLKANQPFLQELFIVSAVQVQEAGAAPDGAYTSQELPELKIGVHQAEGDKCARCWTFSPELGHDDKHPDICPRCSRVMHTLQTTTSQ
ncbi:MAG: isoleucine--tRNA ligase [Desulfovermiculus sp.]